MASRLLSERQRDELLSETRGEYAKIREQREARGPVSRKVSIAEARENRLRIDWQAEPPPRPAFVGIRSWVGYSIEELVQTIDWGPFFRTWEMKGAFPAILEDPEQGEQARSLYEDARAMLRRIASEGWLEARGVVGIFPANAVGDDIEIYTDASRSTVRTVIHTLRQQNAKSGDRANMALADFIAPKGIPDWVGAFAVTTGIGIDEHVRRFEAEHDDYNAILLKALADRLAESFAERLHQRVRKEIWAYAANETLGNEQLIKEQYQGIRPAPGYPACPDHTEKPTLFQLLDAETAAGIQLTESMAMLPAASVSGLYFAHPKAHYFGVGKIERDQLQDYAKRKGWTEEEAERWLSSNLG